MGPVRLQDWKPVNIKPHWPWKAKGSEELTDFDKAFALKEYMQNVGGQLLKDLKVKEWSDWVREDLRTKTRQEQVARKNWLIQSYPGLLTGPHGVSLKDNHSLPLYILSAHVPVPGKTDFKAAVVLWTAGSHLRALSFFNNHLDQDASFESFVIDGESTSKYDEFSVGEKGKGFILATQYLAEVIRDSNFGTIQPKYPQPGISFRVGSQVGELKWKQSRRKGVRVTDVLSVYLHDLTIRPVSEHVEILYHRAIDRCPDGGVPDQYDVSMETENMRQKAVNDMNSFGKYRKQYGFDASHGQPMISGDEVCITIVGMLPTDEPEELFSAIFGIVPPVRHWRIPTKNVEFFFAPDKPRFYNRDQYIPYGVRLNEVSINYHGKLTLSADRLGVMHDARLETYHEDLSANLDLVFRTLPKLAIELAADILTDDHSHAFAGILRPQDQSAAVQYRTAFDLAMRRVHNLDKIPKAFRIMRQSGAYLPIKEHARRNLLLSSPTITNAPGLDKIRLILQAALPALTADKITVRQYDKPYPIGAWDPKRKLFAFARPSKCDEHNSTESLSFATNQPRAPSIPLRKLWLTQGRAPRKSLSSTFASNCYLPLVSRITTDLSAFTPSSNLSCRHYRRPTFPGGSGFGSTNIRRTLPAPIPSQLLMRDDGAALNRTVLAQFGKSVLGFDPVEKYEEIYTLCTIVSGIETLPITPILERDKRHLQDEMEEMDEVTEQLERKRKARVSKRVRFDESQS
ncbi:hypothetical protein R3P38DRAFT_3311068 [Favolaschia claudopus]|uniref:Uncharacterized protein n=1 Tax=Favolaschia claudopus TaxID=2862362 RepID=A0AAW0CJY8_9AGAR